MSESIIDELWISLGFKDAGAKKGVEDVDRSLESTRKSSKTTAEALEKNGAQGALFFKQIRNEALLLTSLFAGGLGLERLLKNTVNSMVELGFTAANMEMAPERLQAWGMAAEKVGGTAEGMKESLARASREAVSFAQENGASVSEMLANANIGKLSFFSMGGKFDPGKYKNDVEGWMMEKSRIFKLVADKFGKADALALAQKMGESEGSFNFLVQGPEAIKAQIDALKELAKRDYDATQKATGLKKLLSEMGDEFRSISDDIVLALIPAMKWLLIKFKELAQWVSSHKEDFAEMIQKWATQLEPFLKKVNELAEKMGGWENVLIGLIAIRFAPFIASLGLLAAGLFRVATGITAIGAAASGGGLLGLTKFLGALAMIFYSKELGTGEEEEIKKHEEELKKNPKALNQGMYETPQGERIFNMLQAKGMTREESLGLMANWYAESGLNPDQKQIGGGPGYGLAQWEKPRQKVFKEKYGKEIQGSSLEEQIDFALYEIREGEERKNWKRAKEEGQGTSAGIASGYTKYVERPKEKERDASNRAIIANQFESLYPKEKPIYSTKESIKESTKETIREAEKPKESNIVDKINALIGHKPMTYEEYRKSIQKPVAIANGAMTKTSNATTNNTSTNDVKIGNITINTQATSAKEIAQSIKPAMTGILFNNFDSGVQA